ncbi:hypothetical protein J3E68DRAFT_391280, partial [Trichoderma sp. SZMC 28012]
MPSSSNPIYCNTPVIFLGNAFLGFVLVQRTDDFLHALGWGRLCLFLITLAEHDTRLHILWILFSLFYFVLFFYFVFLKADLIRCFL